MPRSSSPPWCRVLHAAGRGDARAEGRVKVSGLFVTVLRASLNAWLLQRYSVVTEVDSCAQPPGPESGRITPFLLVLLQPRRSSISGNPRQAENQGYSSRLGEFVPKPKQAVVSPTSGGKGRFLVALASLTEFSTRPKSQTRRWTRAFPEPSYPSCSPSTLVTPGPGRAAGEYPALYTDLW